MSGTVIQVEGLGKRYRIGQGKQHNALSHLIGDALRAPIRSLTGHSNHNADAGASASTRTKTSANTTNGDSPFIWALKDVSFEVKIPL